MLLPNIACSTRSYSKGSIDISSNSDNTDSNRYLASLSERVCRIRSNSSSLSTLQNSPTCSSRCVSKSDTFYSTNSNISIEGLSFRKNIDSGSSSHLFSDHDISSNVNVKETFEGSKNFGREKIKIHIIIFEHKLEKLKKSLSSCIEIVS